MEETRLLTHKMTKESHPSPFGEGPGGEVTSAVTTNNKKNNN